MVHFMRSLRRRRASRHRRRAALRPV